MSPYGDVIGIWYKAYWMLHAYLNKWLPGEVCGTSAGKACGLWFRAAVDGVETTDGAYRALFRAAEEVLFQIDPAHLLGTSEDVVSRIPLYDLRMACDLSRLYAALWQAGQLNFWDRATVNRLSKRLALMHPLTEETWGSMSPAAIDDPEARLSRRAFAVMHDHECVDNPICSRSAVIWEQEEQRSSQWIMDERLAREGL